MSNLGDYVLQRFHHAQLTNHGLRFFLDQSDIMKLEPFLSAGLETERDEDIASEVQCNN